MTDKDTQEKIGRLQLMEQNLQQLLLQKQQFQTQLIEITSAMEELKKTDQAYKIVGNIMVLSKKDELEKDLNTKKEMLDIRIKNIEKQEKIIKEKTQKMQDEVMKKLKK